jgi:hypothetical protein
VQPPEAERRRVVTELESRSVQIFFASPAVDSVCRLEIVCAIACGSPLKEPEDVVLAQADRPTASKGTQSSARACLIETGGTAQRVRDRARTRRGGNRDPRRCASARVAVQLHVRSNVSSLCRQIEVTRGLSANEKYRLQNHIFGTKLVGLAGQPHQAWASPTLSGDARGRGPGVPPDARSPRAP